MYFTTVVSILRREGEMEKEREREKLISWLLCKAIEFAKGGDS